MNRRLWMMLLTSVVGTVGASGCHHCCWRRNYTASAPPCCDPCPPGRLRPFHALTPRRYDALPGALPPARNDVLGPPAVTFPGGIAPVVPPGLSGPVDTRGYGPGPATPPEPSWRPSPDSTPMPPALDSPRPGARLYPPETSEPPVKPDAARQPPASPALPVDIPQFAMARNRIASGLKPSLEGLDWLRENGYRTVVYIRRPGEDDVAYRRQVESKRGIRYVSIELSPGNLREAIETFNALLADVSCQPVFVYDKDSTLQGYLWYLHFRIVDPASHDDARLRAGQLGLKESTSNEAKEMWLAIQKYLSGK